MRPSELSSSPFYKAKPMRRVLSSGKMTISSLLTRAMCNSDEDLVKPVYHGSIGYQFAEIRGLNEPIGTTVVVARGAIGIAFFVLTISRQQSLVTLVGGMDSFVWNGAEVVLDPRHLAR